MPASTGDGLRQDHRAFDSSAAASSFGNRPVSRVASHAAAVSTSTGPALPASVGASGASSTAATGDGDGSQASSSSRTLQFLNKLGLYRPGEDISDGFTPIAALPLDPSPDRLVSLRIEVSTSHLNLDVVSPYRKSRRMPSHEAINFIAGMYTLDAPTSVS